MFYISFFLYMCSIFMCVDLYPDITSDVLINATYRYYFGEMSLE